MVETHSDDSTRNMTVEQHINNASQAVKFDPSMVDPEVCDGMTAYASAHALTAIAMLLYGLVGETTNIENEIRNKAESQDAGLITPDLSSLSKFSNLVKPSEVTTQLQGRRVRTEEPLGTPLGNVIGFALPNKAQRPADPFEPYPKFQKIVELGEEEPDVSGMIDLDVQDLTREGLESGGEV